MTLQLKGNTALYGEANMKGLQTVKNLLQGKQGKSDQEKQNQQIRFQPAPGQIYAKIGDDGSCHYFRLDDNGAYWEWLMFDVKQAWSGTWTVDVNALILTAGEWQVVVSSNRDATWAYHTTATYQGKAVDTKYRVHRVAYAQQQQKS